MTTHWIQQTHSSARAAAVLCLVLSATLGAQDVPGVPGECKPAIDAGTKETMTPHHAYSTQSSGPSSTTGEVIFTGTATYVLYKGAWKRVPITPQQTMEQRRENIRDSKFSGCRRLGDESVDGTPAAIYAIHTETEEGSSDARVWVGKTNGLMLREDVDRVGASGAGKTHVSTRFEYSNIRPPAGAP